METSRSKSVSEFCSVFLEERKEERKNQSFSHLVAHDRVLYFVQ